MKRSNAPLRACSQEGELVGEPGAHADPMTVHWPLRLCLCGASRVCERSLREVRQFSWPASEKKLSDTRQTSRQTDNSSCRQNSRRRCCLTGRRWHDAQNFIMVERWKSNVSTASCSSGSLRGAKLLLKLRNSRNKNYWEWIIKRNHWKEDNINYFYIYNYIYKLSNDRSWIDSRHVRMEKSEKIAFRQIYFLIETFLLTQYKKMLWDINKTNSEKHYKLISDLTFYRLKTVQPDQLSL